MRRPSLAQRLRAAVPGLITLCALSVGGATAMSPASPFGWRVTALSSPASGSYGEPGIVSGPGLLMVSASSANANVEPTWWASLDAGATWGPGANLDPSHAFTGDADSAVAADGYRYVLNLGYNNPPAQPSNPTILVYRSPDGRTWSGPAAIPLPHGVDQPDRPWLAIDPTRPADVLLVNSEGGGDFVAWRSSDHAASFVGPSLMTGPGHPQAALALGGRPMFDPTAAGRIFMVYAAGTLTGGGGAAAVAGGARDFPLNQLWLTQSPDGGQTWTDRLVLDAATAFGASADAGSLAHVLVASAIDARGTIYVAFSLRTTSSPETHIQLVHSSDHGASWSRPLQVDAGELRSNVMPSMVAGAAGRVDLSWYGSPSADFTDTSSAWAEMFAQGMDAAGEKPVFRQSRVSSDRPVHVGDINTAGNVGSNLHNWSLKDFQSLAIDGCGLAHPAWADDSAGGRVYVASQASGPSLFEDQAATPGCASAAASATPGVTTPGTSSGGPLPVLLCLLLGLAVCISVQLLRATSGAEWRHGS